MRRSALVAPSRTSPSRTCSSSGERIESHPADAAAGANDARIVAVPPATVSTVFLEVVVPSVTTTVCDPALTDTVTGVIPRTRSSTVTRAPGGSDVTSSSLSPFSADPGTGGAVPGGRFNDAEARPDLDGSLPSRPSLTVEGDWCVSGPATPDRLPHRNGIRPAMMPASAIARTANAAAIHEAGWLCQLTRNTGGGTATCGT